MANELQVPLASPLKNQKPSLAWNVAKFMMGFVGFPVVFFAWDAWNTVRTSNLKIQAVRAGPQPIAEYIVKEKVAVIRACPVDFNVDIAIPTLDMFRIYTVTGTIHLIAHQSALGKGWARYSVIADGRSAGEVPVKCPTPDVSAHEKVKRGQVLSTPTRSFATYKL